MVIRTKGYLRHQGQRCQRGYSQIVPIEVSTMPDLATRSAYYDIDNDLLTGRAIFPS